MSRYRLTEDAERDLDEIVGFVALDSIAVARQVLRDLHGAMQQLAEMPRMGTQGVSWPRTTCGSGWCTPT